MKVTCGMKFRLLCIEWATDTSYQMTVKLTISSQTRTTVHSEAAIADMLRIMLECMLYTVHWLGTRLRKGEEG